MPTIEERFMIHAVFSPIHLGYLITILLGEDIYLHNHLLPDYVCHKERYTQLLGRGSGCVNMC